MTGEAKTPISAWAGVCIYVPNLGGVEDRLEDSEEEKDLPVFLPSFVSKCVFVRMLDKIEMPLSLPNMAA